jgi:ABC-type glycerol-3-phosphate transport system substrate-binding protein
MINSMNKKITALLLSIIMLLTLLSNSICVLADNQSTNSNSITSFDSKASTSYLGYLKKYQNVSMPSSELDVNLTNFTASQNYATITENIGGRDGKCVETGDDGYIEWTVNVNSDALYNIMILYYPQKGKGSDIVRNLKIDGKAPFDETNNLDFKRSFTNDGNILTDNSGNQLRPPQIEKPIWIQQDLHDELGYYKDPLKFYFSKGIHTIRLESVKEPMTIGNIKLYQSPQIKSYTQVSKQYTTEKYSQTQDAYLEIQGENANLKSDSMLYAITDNSSPAIHNSSYNKILLNTIGGQKWKNYGQWLSWDFSVPKSGLYKIGIKAIQNISAGQPSYRTLYIDGKVPFSELNNIEFKYDTSWKTKTLGTDKDPYLFYLTAGKHTIKLAVSLGSFADVIQKINSSMIQLNSIYLNFLMVTGSNPDQNRDYNFDKLLPDTLKDLKKQSAILSDLYKEYLKINGMDGSQSQQLEKLSKQTNQMAEKPEMIAKLLSDFNTNVSALGSLLTTLKQQPLAVDYISVCSPNVNLKADNSGFLENITFAVQQFISSFFVNYSVIDASVSKKDSVNVWISLGRDQANSLNQLITNDFMTKNKINVSLQLVPAGTLLCATLANKGPDVALTNAQSDPLNFAIRGAVQDLSIFPDIKNVTSRFQPSAMVPLTFNGHIYGMPETQTFPMMFYRKDILKDLGLEVPQTWNDVIYLLPILQKKNLNFALPAPYSPAVVGAGLPTFAMFLYQNDGSFYNKEGTTTNLNSKQAINAFYEWTKFYNDYQLPTQFDFMNRFRSGEIPIGIADYSTYNALSVFAPELEGTWGFSQVPGTKKADGTIDRTVASSVTATVMMKTAKNKENSWKFIKWWTSADIQGKYGNELESIMGTAGRYQPASIEALYQIPWNTSDFKILMQQWNCTQGIPEIPGSYMTPRYLDFAFKNASILSTTSIYQSLISPDEIIQDAAKKINMEIKQKRDEFGLN